MIKQFTRKLYISQIGRLNDEFYLMNKINVNESEAVLGGIFLSTN